MGKTLALDVRLLGGFEVRVAGHLVPNSVWRQRRAAAIVKLLALEPGHRLHREQVLDTLWPDFDPDSAANNLRGALHHARLGLERAGTPAGVFLVRDGDQLLLGPQDRLVVDVDAFTEVASRAWHSADPAIAKHASELYGGDLLPDDPYEEWAAARREGLRSSYLTVLTRLAGLHEERGEHSYAIAVHERILQTDPLDEAAHAGLMRLHAQMGNPQLALAHYARLQSLLDRELGTPPEPATQALAAAIRAGRIPSAPAPSRPPSAPQPQISAAIALGARLPVPVDALVGREREVAELDRLLAAARLVTLTGPGGIGKTRLAQEAARASSGRFPDGVAFVDLAPLRDPSFVLSTIARALGVDETGDRPIHELVVATVGDRRLLLVLDNFEHLTAAATDLAVILAACTRMTVLATSRVRLRLRGEQEYPVLPLALPESTANREKASLSQLSQVAAIELFARRAMDARPNFALTDQNIDTVVAICRRLDGLPLAIELAAAQVRVLAPAQLLQRLERLLDVLGTTAQDVPARQRTLRNAIAWSHDLLSRQEQALFRRLGVFAGGWTLEAAATVTHLEGDLDVFEGLASLVDKSLVQWHDTGAEPRFSILETVREFALERLREEDDQGLATEQAHAGYFLSLAEQAYVGLVGAEQRTWLVRLDAEDANIRAALVWSLEHRSTESALRLARALWRYWSARGRLIEGRSWLERALTLPGVAEAPLSVRADAHNALGNLLGDNAEYTPARQHYEEALALRRKIADSEGIAGALNNLGIVAAWLGDYDGALALYRESLDLRQARHDAFGMALSLSNLGDVLLAQGDFTGAQGYQEEALRLRELVHDAAGSAYSVYNLGEIARLRGDTAEAARYLTDSLTRFEALGDKFGIAYAECSLGDLASQEGDRARAAQLLERALRTRKEIGDKRGVIECLEALAMAAIRLGEDHTGTRLLGAAWAERETLSCPVPPSSQDELDRALAGGRTRLGAATVDALHAEGRRLAPEQALMLAYEIVDRLNARTGAAAPEVMSTTAIPTAVAEAPPKAITVAPPEPRETP